MDFTSRTSTNDWLKEKTLRKLAPIEHGSLAVYARKGSPKEISFESNPQDDGPTSGLWIRDKQYKVAGNFSVIWNEDLSYHQSPSVEQIQNGTDPRVGRYHIQFYRLGSRRGVTDADERDLSGEIKTTCTQHVHENVPFYRWLSMIAIYANRRYKKARKAYRIQKKKERLEDLQEEYREHHQDYLTAKRALKTTG